MTFDLLCATIIAFLFGQMICFTIESIYNVLILVCKNRLNLDLN